MRFTASTDSDVHHLVMDYDLHILPVLMKFDPHARLELPLNSVDVNVVGNWIDDRIIDFVRVFLSLHENQYYLKDHMVADPISGTQFPKYAAATKLDWNGATYYFIGEQTRSEFMAKNGIKS